MAVTGTAKKPRAVCDFCDDFEYLESWVRMVRHRANHPIPNRQDAARYRRQLSEQARMVRRSNFSDAVLEDLNRRYAQMVNWERGGSLAMPSLSLKSGRRVVELRSRDVAYLVRKVQEFRVHRDDCDNRRHFADAGPFVRELASLMRDERLTDLAIASRLLKVPLRLVELRFEDAQRSA